jgi:hypothetical protein
MLIGALILRIVAAEQESFVSWAIPQYGGSLVKKWQWLCQVVWPNTWFCLKDLNMQFGCKIYYVNLEYARESNPPLSFMITRVPLSGSKMAV